MALRISGISSGLDTDSIISELVKAESVKVESLEKEQTMLKWKQDAWKGLNTKIHNFYSKTLTQMKGNSAYQKITSTSSNESVLKVTSGTNTSIGVQSASVTALAKSEYLTGGELTSASGKVTGSTKISDIKGMNGLEGSFYVKSSDDATPMEVKIDGETTVDDLVSQLNKAGVTANFDEGNGRIFVSSKKTGTENAFSFTNKGGTELENNPLLNGLKLDVDHGATKVKAQDAKLVLNGAEFTSSTNSFNINGMTFTATGLSEQDADGKYAATTISTDVDYDGIYDMIKKLFSEYNALVNEMDSLYNAESAKGYEPLTDEEKEMVSETEAKEIEDKIKGALLSNDSTVNGVMSAMYSSLLGGIQLDSDSEEKTYLSDFGIGALGYFNAAANEKHAFYIDGDEDSSATSGKPDKLKAMIASDPDKVISYFTKLSQTMYDNLDQKMARSEYSSIYKVYNDKQMATEYKEYTDKIKEAEAKLTEYEDKWYKKFSAMEVAMSKIQSKESALSGLFNM